MSQAAYLVGLKLWSLVTPDIRAVDDPSLQKPAALRRRRGSRRLLPLLRRLRDRRPHREPAVRAEAPTSPAVYFVTTATRKQLNWIPAATPARVIHVVERDTGSNLALAVAVVAGVVVPAARAARGRVVLVAGWCVLPVALGVLVSQVQRILTDGYLVVITPGLALAASAASATASSSWSTSVDADGSRERR